MKRNKQVVVGIVIPCFNEEEVLADSIFKLEDLLKGYINKGLISENSFIAIVDDGSTDDTWKIFSDLAVEASLFKGIRLSRNFGHQNALLCGLLEFKKQADCLLSIDADLQDDIIMIENMINAYVEGADIVYGVRRMRYTDSFFKRNTALMFYYFASKMGIKLINNHADFRLASKKVLDSLAHYGEVNLFLRGVFPSLGFQSAYVYYDRKARTAGKSKYSTKKMLSFAIEGVTSFSSKPLRYVTLVGFLISILSLLLTVYAVFSYLFLDVVKGWVSTVLPIYFIGGIQLLSLGVFGEYLHKLYLEVKKRPRYIIDERVN